MRWARGRTLALLGILLVLLSGCLFGAGGGEGSSGTINVVDTDAADIPVDDEGADISCLPEGSIVREAVVTADAEGQDYYDGESLAFEEYQRVVESSETGCGTRFVEYNGTVYRVNWNN
jgi:hypothetical protein